LQDNGCGVPKGRLNGFTDGDGGAGVGIAGKRERVRELCGSLEIQSDRTGTKVIVTIPLLEQASGATENSESGRSGSAAWCLMMIWHGYRMTKAKQTESLNGWQEIAAFLGANIRSRTVGTIRDVSHPRWSARAGFAGRTDPMAGTRIRWRARPDRDRIR